MRSVVSPKHYRPACSIGHSDQLVSELAAARSCHAVSGQQNALEFQGRVLTEANPPRQVVKIRQGPESVAGMIR